MADPVPTTPAATPVAAPVTAAPAASTASSGFIATVKTDVTKVETAIKTDIADVKADESKLSRTKLAWICAGIGALLGFLAHYL